MPEQQVILAGLALIIGAVVGIFAYARLTPVLDIRIHPSQWGFTPTILSLLSRLSAGGLSLTIAEAIVEAHGGRITAVRDGLGRGTAVRFELPIRA